MALLLRLSGGGGDSGQERAKTFIKSVESEFVARGVKDADDQRSIGVGVPGGPGPNRVRSQCRHFMM